MHIEFAIRLQFWYSFYNYIKILLRRFQYITRWNISFNSLCFPLNLNRNVKCVIEYKPLTLIRIQTSLFMQITDFECTDELDTSLTHLFFVKFLIACFNTHYTFIAFQLLITCTSLGLYNHDAVITLQDNCCFQFTSIN